MTIAVEAIYEAGVLKPVRPLNELKDKDRVLLKLETLSLAMELDSQNIIERQRRQRLILEPEMADDLMNNSENDLLEV